MRLKSLEIQGFKSFPDKLNINFSDGVTAIVGPNGSGKSNISDAIRWVLGEQSTKNLRGSKMEDVIFNGAQGRTKMGFAQVTMILENDDKMLPVEYDEVAITRKYYRSGESEYSINKNAVRLKDIRELFMDTGLGREGYSVIGQGKIAEILSARDDELRHIFEEAAGITKYRYKKEEAQRKLEQTEQNLERLNDLLFDLSERVGPLKEQSEKALYYKELKESLKKSDLLFSLRKIDSLESSKEKASEDERIARLDFESVKEKIDGIFQKTEQNTERLRILNLALEKEKNEISTVKEESIKTENEITLLLNDNKNLLENKDRLLKESEGELLKNDETVSEINELNAQKESLLSNKEEVTADLLQKQAELVTIQDAEEKLSEEISRLQSEKEAFTIKLAGTDEKRTGLLYNIETLKKRNEELVTIIASREEEKKKREERLSEGHKYCETLKEEILSSRNKQAGCEKKKEFFAEKVSSLTETLEKAKKDYAECAMHLKVLSDTENEYEGYSRSVKAVMKKAKEGSLKNIYGTLSSVITVSDEVATAIEVALGGALSNIVTATNRDAKNAIDYLKVSNGGRATFLPATSMSGRKISENDVKNSEGFVAIASDAVSSDEKFLGVIENLLGRTVIVDTLEHALKISKKFHKSFRIVTLDGQIINTSGAMTGGSYAKDSGLLHRKNELLRLKEQNKKLSETIQKLQSELKTPELELLNVEIELTNLKEEKLKQENELIKSDALLSHIEEELRLMEENADAFFTEKKLNEEKIKTIEEANAALLEEKEEISLKFGQNNEEIESLLQKKDELSKQKDSLYAQRTEISTREIVVSKDIEALEEKIAELSLRLTVRSKRKEEKEEEGNRLSIMISENESKVQTLREFLSNAEKEIPQKEENISRIEQERRNLDLESTALRKEEKDLNETLMSLQKILTVSEAKLESVKKDYDQILDRLWEDYEITYNGIERMKEEGAFEGVKADNATISSLNSKIRALGEVNLSAIEEYKNVSERYEYLHSQVLDLEKAKTDIEGIIREVTKKMKTIFEESFTITRDAFSKAFSELFGGGKADVLLENPDDILASRIEIRAQPPGKNVKSMSLLSGGEQALTAIALLFAMISVRPTPFCVFDEIEAALDDINISRFVRYIERFNDTVQFILITHRRGTMEAADILYGVTMQEKGVSNLLSINVRDIEREKLLQK